MSSADPQHCNVLKSCAIVLFFSEALFAGYFPTYNRNCRENPKILGIANAFAGGVFMAIAFVHILPEAVADYTELKGPDAFPLPNVLLFVGYSIILLIDKVMFDTHSLFEDDEHCHDGVTDPAAKKF